MLRILYAADNRPSSFYSLKRFLDSYGKFYNIRTAAYSKSVGNLNINWNLDALLDFRGRYNGICTTNSNFALYVREVKRFAPHLIISDMELYSSYIGLDLGIPVWQVSPALLYYGIEHKLNIFRYYSGVIARDARVNKYTNYVIGNSDKKLVLSHLGDVPNSPTLKESFDWVRPNYNVIDEPDKINGCAVSIADCYFSGYASKLNIDYTDMESIVASQINYDYNLSVRDDQSTRQISASINNNIKFLSQYLKELDI